MLWAVLAAEQVLTPLRLVFLLMCLCSPLPGCRKRTVLKTGDGGKWFDADWRALAHLRVAA